MSPLRAGRPTIKARRSLVLLVLAIGSLATIADQPPSTSAEEVTTFMVALTAEEPVAVRTIVAAFDSTGIPSGATASTAYRMEFDARVRLTLLAAGALPIRINQSAHDNLFGLQGNCSGKDRCTAEARLIFELTDPTAAPLNLEGRLTTRIFWQGEEPRGNRVAMTFTGLDGPGQAAPVVTRSRADGPVVHLDARHPVEVHRVRVRFDPTAVADAERLAPDIALIADGDDPATGTLITKVELWSEPGAWVGGNGGYRLGGPVDRVIPISVAGCDVGKLCEQDYRVIFSWKGAPSSSRTIKWAIEAGVRDYAEQPAAKLPSVDAEYVGGWTVPDDAPRLTETFSGEFRYSGGNDRGGGHLRVNLTAAATKGDEDTGRIPSRVIWTWEATERGGPRDRTDAPIRMLIQNSWHEMFAADGRPRTFSVDLLDGCRPNGPCEGLDFIQVFLAEEAQISYPMTVRWTAVVEVTSFSTEPFGPDANITLAVEERR